MNDDQIDMYNEHAKAMAMIALGILEGNTKLLKENNGIKELIAFYLLIPYITKKSLIEPDDKCKIPKIYETFIGTDDGKEIKLQNIRDSICHSFLTIDNDNEGNRYIIIDDRAAYNKRDIHDGLPTRGKMYKIPVDYCHNKLLEIFKEILTK